MNLLVRLDKWLWAARFFKTRAMARAAIQGGKIQLNGTRTKPGRVLNAGDQLRIQRGEEIFHITVKAISDRRGPAKLAQNLYSESEESRLRREAVMAQRALQRSQYAQRQRRPDKRERRRIIQFLNKD